MKQKQNWLVILLIALLGLIGASNVLGQSSSSLQGGNFDVPGLKEPAERYEVFLGEGKFLVEITISVASNADTDVELRDEGFGGDIRAKILKGTTKTVVLTTKLLALRPATDRRALGTYQVTILERAR